MQPVFAINATGCIDFCAFIVDNLDELIYLITEAKSTSALFIEQNHLILSIFVFPTHFYLLRDDRIN